MKRKLKGAYLLVTTFIVAIFHLPFAFGRTAWGNRFSYVSQSTVTPSDSTQAPSPLPSLYDSLHLDLAGLNRKAFDYAEKGWSKLVAQGLIHNSAILAIADFSQSSSKKRLYILDLKNYKILFQTLVAHGRNSGREWATSFSNKTSSNKSSAGFFVTGDTYNGSNGYSLKLTGVEKGINDNAYNRAIVVHGADYVSESMAANRGYIGRSWGCPAIPLKETRPIINTIRNSTCFFIYQPDESYPHLSTLLN